jgi:hypothetical protein
MAETPLERAVLDRHRKHPHPHPQYAKLTDLAERTGAVVGSTVGSDIVISGDASAGASTEAARADHTHDAPGYASSSSGGFMRSSHVVAISEAAAAANRACRVDDESVWSAEDGTPVVVLTDTGVEQVLVES